MVTVPVKLMSSGFNGLPLLSVPPIRAMLGSKLLFVWTCTSRVSKVCLSFVTVAWIALTEGATRLAAGATLAVTTEEASDD